jgi:hypothetical protein
LLVGLLRLRKGWLVPLAFVLIDCATEPLGGVPLWSLLRNEGPMLLIVGLPVGFASFAVGWILRLLIERLRHARN